MSVIEAVRSSLRLLSARTRGRLALVLMVQMATSFLDLAGVLLIGLAAAGLVAQSEGSPLPSALRSTADFVGLGGSSTETVVLLMALLAAAVLMGKSIISPILMKRIFSFLARQQATVSESLTERLLSQPLPFILRRSTQEIAFALLQGAGNATMMILGQLSVVITESFLLLVLTVALLLVDPVVTVAAVVFFTIVALVLQFSMGRIATRLGIQIASVEISSLNAIQEAVNAYREILVSNRRSHYVSAISRLRYQAAQITADTIYIGLVPKYVFEASLVVGGFALTMSTLLNDSTTQAIGTIALFMAAATRVIPSILRLQGSALSLRGLAGTAQPTFKLWQELSTRGVESRSDIYDSRARLGSEARPTFNPTIHMDGVSFTYSAGSAPAVHNVTLRLSAGQSLAIVGKSGAGKSTLADLILGVVSPDAGSVTLGERAPQEVFRNWPGAVAYVPQQVLLANASVRRNVALGLQDHEIDDARVTEVLNEVDLLHYFMQERQGLNTPVGESGARLSGGQRQRLGIARALYTRPKLVILDEATSALDADTEAFISEALDRLLGAVTLVTVAHRLSTVRRADVVAYLDHGHLVAAGSFDAVRQAVPAFERQANLMGL